VIIPLILHLIIDNDMDLFPADILKIVFSYCKDTLVLFTCRRWYILFKQTHNKYIYSQEMAMYSYKIYLWVQLYLYPPKYLTDNPRYVIQYGTLELLKYLVEVRQCVISEDFIVDCVRISRGDLIWYLDAIFRKDHENITTGTIIRTFCSIERILSIGNWSILDWLKSVEAIVSGRDVIGNIKFCLQKDYLNAIKWYYKNYYGNFMAVNPIRICIISNSIKILSWLLKEIKMPSMLRFAPLTASKLGSMNMMKILVSFGCIITTEAMYLAAKNKHIDIVIWCIERNVYYTPHMIRSLIKRDVVTIFDNTDEKLMKIAHYNEQVYDFHIWLCNRDKTYKNYYDKNIEYRI